MNDLAARPRSAAIFLALLLPACVHNLKFPKTTFPDGELGEEYNAKLDLGSCDTRINTSSVDSGKLPPGIGVAFIHDSEAHNFVLLQGVPHDVGTFKFTLGATCKGMEDNEVLGRYALKIVRGEGVAGLRFDEKNPPAGTVGADYDALIPIGKCENALQAVEVAKGKLPLGLTAEPSTDDAGDYVHIAGTPKKAGTYKFTLLASCGSAADSLASGPQLTHAYVLKISK